MQSRPMAMLALIALMPATASAQIGVESGNATVTINATKNASLTVTINSGAAQTLPSITDGATNDFPVPVNITTAWDLNPSASSVDLVAWFANPANALVNGTFVISSSSMRGRVTTGLPAVYTPFTQNAVATAGSAGGSLHLFTEPIAAANKAGARTDNLDLQLDLTGQTTTPGTYAGVITIKAVTQ